MLPKNIAFWYDIISHRLQMNALDINHVTLEVAGREILHNFSLKIPFGEVHALVGKNGAGKSSLAKSIAGCPGYNILDGEIVFNGKNIVGMSSDEISREGFFLAFQNPVEVPGVSVANFIRAALQARMEPGKSFNAIEFYKRLYEYLDALNMDRNFTGRSLNDGFSGGEKKRCEVLQMLMLQPSFVVLDETDSGLDIDALKTVSQAINSMRNDTFSALIITHYNKLLEYIRPDKVHVVSNGIIVKSGGIEIIEQLERSGYDGFDHNDA